MTIEKCTAGVPQTTTTDLEKINILTEEIKNLAQALKGKASSLHPLSEVGLVAGGGKEPRSTPAGAGPTLIYELAVIQQILSDAMSALAGFF